ncbi:Cysteine/Histidine-rich C1 domain family protein [Raphanus sativus]|nr:Cysteine/Histidine-rich C1 domain family protein [Raphanus sativus]
MMYGSYYCNEAYCDYRFHKDCAESPLEINHHPSHPEHSLLLTMISPEEFGTPCDFCGQEIESICYDCPTCKFKVDLICGTKPSPSVIEHPVCHDHTLVFLKKEMKKDRVPCDVCKESISGPSYSCLECNNVYFHLDCVHLSKEVNHSCHSSHPLKIMLSESLIDDDDDDDDDYYEVVDDDDDNDAQKSCHFCLVQPEKVFYHCSICNFTLCIGCTKHPPPLVVDDAKTHTHPLTLFPSAKCGVCREKVSQYYGAYSCAICPKYVVHSLCAANFTAWNGVELEGIPETSEDVVPFKVMGDNLIRHFSHEKHILLLLKDYDMVGDDYERLRCQACVSPIGFGPVYSCQYCRFFLHEKCAYLPLKKNLVFGSSPYKLEYQGKVVYCKLCGIFSGGFKYISLGPSLVLSTIDVRCSSISEPFVYNGHFHPLYFVKTKKKRQCNACGRYPDGYMLTCGACDFDLCLYCATLPERIWHISDEHPLTLNYGGKKAIGKNWCQVCEMKLDSRKWFFTCFDCGVTLHVGCVLGDFSWLDPNCSVSYRGKEHLAILNRQNSRPFCRHCHDRCKAPVILQVNDEHNGYICSRPCLLNMAGYV